MVVWRIMSISKEELKSLRERYPIGCRVELLQMDDTQAPPVGAKGTVNFIDDIGSIHTTWDNGSSLAVVYGVDSCRRIDKW